MKQVVRIGVGGPVGAGKTMLVEKLTRVMADDFSMAVVTMIFIRRKMRYF
jgi:urease accessory protein